jgi:Flp pilus assembly pilin Flp
MFRGEEGQTLTEYALIIFFIALACVVTLTILGVNLGAAFQSFANMFPGV